jgi:hypothetical protein
VCVGSQALSVRSDSAQPPTFYILPTHPSFLFFTTHTRQNSSPATPHANYLSRLSATRLNQHYDHTNITQEQPLRMTVRSPIGALSRYLPYGFFFTCLLVRLFCSRYSTTACVATVMCFFQSIFPIVFAILAARLHRTIMDATGTTPRETLRDMDPHRPPLPLLYTPGSRTCSMPELRLASMDT